MARLQDFQTVTPTSSDKLLVVQSQGQGLASWGSKLDSANPTGTGSLSLNRKSGTTTGSNSTTVGTDCEASGAVSFAEGYGTKASGIRSHASGSGTIASHEAQFVFGEYNVEDTTGTTTTRGQYIEVVGKGVSANARSNARTLDWSGNEVLAGGLTVNGNATPIGTIYTDNATGVAVANATFVTVKTLEVPKGVFVVFATVDFGSSTTGNRIVMLENAESSTNTYANSTVVSGRGTIQRVRIFNLNATTTLYMRAYQNSGASMNVDGQIVAVRIA